MTGRYWRCWLLAAAVLVTGPVLADCRDLAPARPLPSAEDGQISLATFNLWRLRDARKDSSLDRPLSKAVYQARLEAVARYITRDLRAPALLAVQEVESATVLKALSRAISTAGGPDYKVVLLEGHDPAGMDVGLLYRAPVTLGRHQALFADDRFQRQPLFTRPPLKVEVRTPVVFDLVVVHLRSARDLNQKDWVAPKRRRQAAAIAGWAADQTRPVVVAGDFNSAPDSGRFSEPLEQFENGDLISAWSRLPEKERYSFRHQCRPQALDHIFFSPSLKQHVQKVAVSRGNAGRYDVLYDHDGTRVVSDHDVLGIYLNAGALAD
ncbi:endonuclease/exonuclease/phosphatase family protein [Alloalcanivorax xenomutans]|uniref:endonuclease/exonuclease/phosphatase family protein n=1 Tax=Alloalcanivorax xenomutans TaxID=1094342 RepID=UPI0029348FFB|nr:endonuclease/exonuclease/phosphatase family protein [Alloalcanivorax xenomutans]WOD29494.1 endonuclease/exonuclease/phosphatase family protein [Alloalcanivorax xenomutans]